MGDFAMCEIDLGERVMSIVEEASAWAMAFWSITGLFVATVVTFYFDQPMLMG
jgi:hypothetical protein